LAAQRDMTERRTMAENIAAILVTTRQKAWQNVLETIPPEVRVWLLAEWDDYLQKQEFMPTPYFFLIEPDDSGEQSRDIKSQLKDRYASLFQHLQKIVESNA
jgi:hypothetical protein